MAFIKLDTIVKQLCRRTGEPEYRNYDDILEHVVSACRQLNLLNMTTISYEVVTLNNCNAIDWPLDCVKPLIIGQVRNNRMAILSVDEGIMPGHLNQCNTISEAENHINEIFSGNCEQYQEFSIGDNWGIRGYGCGFNNVGYVNHDKKARQSYIKGRYESGDEFVMVFKSDGVSNGMSMIPSETEMCVKSFALREYYSITNPSISALQDRRYKEEFNALTKFNSAINADEWRDLIKQLSDN